MDRLKRTLTTLALFGGGMALAVAQTTTFTYQGQLNLNGAPYSGNAEFQPTLWDAASSGSQVVANSPAQVIVAVTNGLFTLPLDFGSSFPGSNRWLQLEVRTGIGAFTSLSPRQQVVPTPYAITAAGVSGTVPASQLSGALNSSNLSGTYDSALTLNNAANSFTGNGAGLTGLNASQLTTGRVPEARMPLTVAWKSEVWSLNGNAGTAPEKNFIGTTDDQPLELRINGVRVLRFEDNGDGAWDSNADPDGAPNLIGGSFMNSVVAGVVGATIAGGGATNINSQAQPNLVAGDYGTVGGGAGNEIGAASGLATIAGGSLNRIGADSLYSTIGGGRGNRTEQHSYFDTIAGGADSVIRANSHACTIGGGNRIRISEDCLSATVAGGEDNTISTNSDYSVIGGGRQNSVADASAGSTIAGGYNNNLGSNSEGSVIGGGELNSIRHDTVNATIAGGWKNTIGTNSNDGVIGGGGDNSILDNGWFAIIAGGRLNEATNYAFAAGNRAKAVHTGAFVWADHQDADFTSTGDDQFLVRAGGGVGINKNDPATALDVNGTVTAGSLVSYGDSGNSLLLRKSGSPSTSNAQFVFSHRPNGTELWLYGYDGSAYHNLQGWDNANNTVRFPANGDTLYINESTARVGIGRTPTANALEVNGNASKTTAGSWLANSDARIKRDIEPVTDALNTLDKVRLVSFRYTDNYRNEHPSVEDRRYLNVVAQEFAKVFPNDVKSSGEKLPNGDAILQVDTYPLTIYSAAAVQELNRKVEQQRAENAELKRELREVKELVHSLMHQLTDSKHGGQQ